MSKVSVIIPIYNVEQYLSKCLDSVINQTYKNIEIICVNDCSPDNSIEILEEYTKKDDRIIIFNNKVNQGLSAARNIVIRHFATDRKPWLYKPTINNSEIIKYVNVQNVDNFWHYAKMTDFMDEICSKYAICNNLHKYKVYDLLCQKLKNKQL